MTCYKEEIFGPVLCIVRADTFEKGIEIINKYIYLFIMNLIIVKAIVGVTDVLSSPSLDLMLESMKFKLDKSVSTCQSQFLFPCSPSLETRILSEVT